MYKVNDYIVYKRAVCKIKNIKTNSNTQKESYVLIPIDDESLTIEVPVDNGSIRNIISKEEVERLINIIPDIEIINLENNKLFEQEYKNLLNTGKHEDLIKIIKTTYLRNDKRNKNGKKICEKDDNYFTKAERLLYNEFAISLNINFDEAKKYVASKIKKILKEKNN